jgi:hypothetical protein
MIMVSWFVMRSRHEACGLANSFATTVVQSSCRRYEFVVISETR